MSERLKLPNTEADMEQLYETIGLAWKQAGLAGRQVFATVGWHTAEEAVRQHCDAAGWTGPLWGPGYGDTWANWLHILSHSMDEAEGHSLAHAELERRLVEVAIVALAKASAPSR